MRVLHTADWHLGRTLEGRSRKQEHVAFFEELELIIKDEQIDVLCMAGDVFDSVNPPAFAEELFYENIAVLSQKYELPIIVIAGNHDHPGRLQATKMLAEQRGVYMAGYPDAAPLFVPVKSEVLQVAALPYPSESRMQTVLSDNSEETSLQHAYNEKIAQIFQQLTSSFKKDYASIAMSHVFTAGGAASDSERPIEVGGAYTVSPLSFPANVQYTALGHLHRPQTITKGDRLIRYSGSPLALSFSEAGYSKSVTVIDINPNEQPDVKEIPLSCGRPLITWKAVNGMEEVFQWMEEKKDSHAWIDLELHLNDTPSMEEIHRIRKAHEGIIHIRPVFPEMEQLEQEEKRKDIPIDVLFKKYYERQTGGASPDDKLVRLFMELTEGGES
ncbi:Exodeoxyribonuclease I subunit D [Alteribacillus persepolensis]|uniref:Nuclease SbcCD subunit D n=1 Tax=Alteribacillus persepolensis TaxID=568899 RepID=A0A1G7Z7W6_9BACI|nr:exonuclease SbcCD subunit D [Alteribacillus persepolensis]SDH04841.1 Exodeoxyribonuclease I subunit D [Alteribacillus persepolensis]